MKIFFPEIPQIFFFTGNPGKKIFPEIPGKRFPEIPENLFFPAIPEKIIFPGNPGTIN